MEIIFKPIGYVHSSFTNPDDMPRQPKSSNHAPGQIEILDAYTAGLKDLDGFSHIVLLCYFHKSKEVKLLVNPPRKHEGEVGVFASRSPSRPNPIGLSVVRLDKIEGNLLYISGHDLLDGTPVLDIKPYLPEVGDTSNIRFGWLDGHIQT
jgi:tRNA-Thr(GGU) m(6)t(6)A37 methyltransferase TsaA